MVRPENSLQKDGRAVPFPFLTYYAFSNLLLFLYCNLGMLAVPESRNK